ncbi:hypothetical protein Y032_0017g3357 [Ancylostoma ceylanicum]|uniref:Uncharacterized protein n=1 Tax=Ancylostoma ceylanicum TaxID=53326 RepID=A0A016V4S8_9BILA|nr:hypothetical protein Y032_0017g3357 [Ancylostoma ceylanicum]
MSLTSPETLKFGEISSTRVFAGAAFIVALLEHMFAQKFVDGMLYSPSGVHLRLSHGLLMQSEICAFIARFFEGKHSQQKDVFPTVSEYTERDYGHRCFASCIRNDESAQAVHVAARSLADIKKITMKSDTQSRDDDVDCWQAWILDRVGGLVVSDRRYMTMQNLNATGTS